MLYSNCRIKVKDGLYEDPKGILRMIPMPGDDIIPEIMGFRPDLSLVSRQGELLVGRAVDASIYLVLSTYREDPSFGYGFIKALKGQKNKTVFRKIVLSKHNTSSWDLFVVKAQPNDIFRVTWSGYLSGKFRQAFSFYVVKDKGVLALSLSELEQFYKGAMPFTLDENGHIRPEEWESLSYR